MWRAWKSCCRNGNARRGLRRALSVNKWKGLNRWLLLDLQDSGNDSSGALVVVFVGEKSNLRADKINHEIEGLGLAACQLEGHRISSRARVVARGVTAYNEVTRGVDVGL